MDDTRIRWAEHTWNPMTGCDRVSPGCEHCYAETIATRFGPPAFPNGFRPTFKPNKLGQPARWRQPARVFVNSMSDVFHPAFEDAQIAAVFDAMDTTCRHDYLILTKRPKRQAAWMAARYGDNPPAHIWCGTSIEADRYTWRGDTLRETPAAVRFISAEPLLEPLPSLDLSGIDWLIVGGESGPGYRPMDHTWARWLRDAAEAAGTAFFFKQSAAARTEVGITLDGERYEAYPRPHPSQRLPIR